MWYDIQKKSWVLADILMLTEYRLLKRIYGGWGNKKN